MSETKTRVLLMVLALGCGAVAFAQLPALGPGGNGARYATDAYPGFDSEDDNVKPERKEPRWFQFVLGPKRDNAADQYAYCQELVKDESWSKACRELDGLVRNWPTAPEAWKAQQQMADIRLTKLGDAEDAFADYRYLLDFYSLQCDYAAIADKLYEVAGIMKLEGKEIMFVRFANTVDVRRAYEMCVLRAPGASWVPDAMLIIAALREEEGKYTEAIKVYENLRNLYPESDEAKTAVVREAGARMTVLGDHGYNRARTQDTIDFMKMALQLCRPDDVAEIRGHLEAAMGLLEDEAYRGARFYDSVTRTKRSAVNAYEQFLKDYPQSAHADEVRARVAELKEAEK
ncbi:MAG: tetratricopeptide repeat protein [bacterium]|nr:tetratricopeptide repeat protein [Candidatus Colisoma equi]